MRSNQYRLVHCDRRRFVSQSEDPTPCRALWSCRRERRLSLSGLLNFPCRVPYCHDNSARMSTFGGFLDGQGDPRLHRPEVASAALVTRWAKASVNAALAQHFREVVRQMVQRNAVFLNALAREHDRFSDRRTNIEGFHHQFGWVREVVDLSKDLVESIDFLYDDFVKVLSEIRIVETFRQELRKGLDRDERFRISCDMLAARSVQKAARSTRSCFWRRLSSAVRSWRTATAPRRLFLVHQPSGSTERDRRVLASIHAGGEILVRLEGLAEKRCEAAARRLNGLIQSISCRDAENPFSSGIKPTNDRLFIRRDNAGRNRP